MKPMESGLVVVLVAVTVAIQAQVTPVTITLFEGARLITGDATPPIENSAILVEKDFECLVPRTGEDPRDLYDNPAKD